MRIGMFTDAYTPDINGVVSSIVTLKEELEKLGNEVFVITTKPVGKEEGDDKHLLRLSGIELKNLYGYVLTSPYHFFALEKIRQMNLDVIHVHTEFSVGIFARSVAKNLKLPLVCTYHTMYEDYTHYVNMFDSKTIEKLAKHATRSLSRLYGDACTELIVPSDKTKKRMEAYGVKKEIFVIPTGLELSQFDIKNTSEETKKELREKYGYKSSDFILACVGRVASEKSIDMVIKAFSIIKQHHKPIYLLVVGGGQQLEELKNLTTSLDLNDYVQFTDRIPHENIAKYYHFADAFVSASTSETQGMTYIEALASEMAVFARNDEVVQGLVEEGVTGFLFDNSEQLASKVELYATYPIEKKQEIQKEARKRADNYDCELFGRRVMEVYKKAIETFGKDYQVNKVKMKGDLVEVFLSNDDQDFKVIITLEQLSKGRYHKGLKISKEELVNLLEEEKYADAYNRCLRKLTAKDRTRKEIYDFLTNETELDIKRINEIVDTLEQRGYINDSRYMMSQIESMKMMKVGRQKIARTLAKKGIVQTDVEEILDKENSELEIIRGTKWAERAAASIKDKSVKAKKIDLRRRLSNQGYSDSSITEIINKLDFSGDKENESEALAKMANKALKRYSKKYQGSQLRNTIVRFLLAKGFEYDDVYRTVKDLEENYD